MLRFCISAARLSLEPDLQAPENLQVGYRRRGDVACKALETSQLADVRINVRAVRAVGASGSVMR